MKESELTLIGHLNPLGDVYPTPLIAVVKASKGLQFLVYPDGERIPFSLLDSNRVLVRWLDPKSQVPYGVEGRVDFLYGVNPDYTLIGDQPSVVRNLRLALSSLDPESPAHRLITEFIEGDRQSTH